MYVWPWRDDERLLILAGRVVVLALLVLALILMALRAWAGERMMPSPGLSLEVRRSRGLSAAEREEWMREGARELRRLGSTGLGPRLAADLAQLCLDQGWPVAVFRRLGGLALAARDAGADPLSAARNAAWRIMGGKSASSGGALKGGCLSGRRLRAVLRSWLGAPYRYGGDGRDGIDCSGLVRRVYAELGLRLPRGSFNQARVGRPVRRGELRLGDLVFFARPGKGVVHVGLYLGNGFFIHSARGNGVRVSSLSETKYKRMYHSARRVACVAIRQPGRPLS